ncbi:MAG TPA: hypothetical protein DEP66_02615, partial [Acidimicrobiaceae bacterium]|nr:hypothetical protein [Acidimicrobiaceae bacterium]HCB37116.1 hypothetical protein [Acidimicrobiaceae bacterium]
MAQAALPCRLPRPCPAAPPRPLPGCAACDGRLAGVRAWSVGGGIIVVDDCVLLVHNRRNNGGSDWTTPGGVIDPGETLLEGLTREVSEETGLAVAAWRGPVYTVVAEAPDMDWRLSVEAHHSTSHNGELSVDDPDGIVFDADWVPLADVEARLDGSQLWFTEPLLE